MKQIGKLKILSDFRPADRLSELEEVPKIGNRIDYWQAAKMLCEKDGGHLATREELAQIASEIYVNDDGSPVKIKKDDNTCYLRIKSRHKSNPPLVFGLSSYWSSDEYDASKAYYWYFGISTTGGDDNYWDYKSHSNNRAICIVNIQDRLDLVNELEQECERSRKRISDLEERIINHSNTVEEYCNRLANKQKECEELKTENEDNEGLNMDKEVKWVSLKELLKLLKEMDVWTIDTKYLHLYLDTRFINGDWHCTIRDRENNKYLSIEELKEIRGKFNDR